MKNRYKVFLLLLVLSLITLKVASANEFSFETEEIQIYEEGNLTKAFNGVARSTQNNLLISAKEFEYNKEKSLLKAFNGIATYASKNIEVKANNFEYFEKKFLIKAYGNVNVKDLMNDINIKTESITFNIKNEILKSDNKSEMTDSLGNFFVAKNLNYKVKDKLIKINDAFLTDIENNKYKISKAFVDLKSNRLIGKDISIDFNNNEFLVDNEPRLKGNSIISNKNETIITKGVFTTCKKNDDCPPWQFSAQEIKHDKKKKLVNYKNAWLTLYDKKVFYFPKFFHPDPTVKRQSGFLMPSFEDSSSNGTSFITPYYLVVTDNKDFTFNPRFYSNDKLLLQTEYRQVNKRSKHIFDFSSIQQKNKPSKSHFFSKSYTKINLNNFDEGEVTFNLQQTSNDTYLKTHKLRSPIIDNENLLTSSVGISAYREDFFLDSEITVFEDLNKSKNDRYEFIYPSFTALKEFNNLENISGNLSLQSAGFLKNYDTNVYETVFINDLIFNSSPKYSDQGFQKNYNVVLKNINTDSEKSTRYKNTTDYKLATIFENNISYPLKRTSDNDKEILKPKISLRFSPNNNKNLRDEERRIDINNIFSLGRIGANDTLEGGASFTYGLDYLKTDKDDQEILGARIASMFRLDEDNNLPKNSSLGRKTSDIVGDFKLSFNEILNIKYDFSIDENLSDTNHQLLETEISVNNFITKFEYLNQNNTGDNETYLTNKTSYIINDTKKLSYETRRNKKTRLTEFYNLIYEYRNDCLLAAIEYNKDYYNDRDLKPEENIFFRLTIMPFGQASSPNLKK